MWDVGDGAVLDFESYEVSRTGTLTVDLTLPLPAAGAVEIAGTQVYSDPDSDFTVRQRTLMRTRWDGGGPAR